MKKVLVCVIAVIIAAVACVAAYNLLFKEDAKIAVKDDGTFYGMSVSELMNIKGVTEKRVRNDDKNISMYDYTEDLYGAEAKFTYTFKKDFFGSYLYKVDITSEIADESERARVFDELCTSLQKYYKESGTVDKDNLKADFSMSHGGHKPAVSASFDGNTLTVSCQCKEHI